MKDVDKKRAAREAKSRAMAESLQAKRKQLQEKLAARRQQSGKRPEKDDRRWWLIVLLLLLILGALLRDCSCNPPPPPVEPAPCPTGVVPSEPAEPEPVPDKGTMGRKDRPEFQAEPPKPLPWLAAFRMQVAARSPRLAACFVGVQQPGRLKWSTAVEPAQGLVSAHTLEPMLLSQELSRKERECVLAVLSDPPYQLQIDEERSTPSRVGLVIEF